MKLLLNLPVLATLLIVAPSHGAETQHRDQHRQTKNNDSEIKFGLALNGGSYTAANGCGGFMRGFQQQKVSINGDQRPAMEAFDLVSGLSGGNFPNMVYHYAPFVTSDEILDAAGINDPSKITTEELEVIPKKSLFTPYIIDPKSCAVIVIATAFAADTSVLFPVLWSFLHLQPFGIAYNTKMDYARIRLEVKSTPLFSASMLGPFDAYPDYVFSEMSRDFISEFADTYESRLERYGPEMNEYYQMNNDYLMELVEKHGYRVPIPAFASHEGLEVPFMKTASMTFDNVGNKTIDTVEFSPINATFAELSSESDPFTIEKTLGIATDAAVVLGGPFFWDAFGAVPPSMQDPITVNITTADGGKRRMVFSDGGFNDGFGVPSLVNKKTKHIISLCTMSPHASRLDSGGPKVASNVDAQLAHSVAFYFGLRPYVDPQGLKDFAAITNPFIVYGYFNHIFNVTGSNGENHYNTLVANLKSLQAAGEPMITTLKNIQVVDNPFYGIKGGWTLDFTFVLNAGVPSKFAEQIPEGIATPPPGRDLIEDFYFTNETFATVPNVRSITAGGFNLPVKPARMTQIMNSWIIAHAWEGPLIGADGKEKFGGFKKLFEDEIEDDAGNNNNNSRGVDTSGVCTDASTLFVAAIMTTFILALYLIFASFGRKGKRSGKQGTILDLTKPIYGSCSSPLQQI